MSATEIAGARNMPVLRSILCPSKLDQIIFISVKQIYNIGLVYAQLLMKIDDGGELHFIGEDIVVKSRHDLIFFNTLLEIESTAAIFSPKTEDELRRIAIV